MTKLVYESWKPRAHALSILAQADAIASDYQAQGYDLTLRQLYYQFVSRDLIPNNQKSYDSLGAIINKGRLAGYIDWDHIVDRTRNLAGGDNLNREPSDVLHDFATYEEVARWDGQTEYVEVWVEKEALAGVVERAARRNFVSYFSCRGYVSQSEMWSAAQRLRRHLLAGRSVTILHLGDHDPSGIDMTRDITDRLRMFIGTDLMRRGTGGLSYANMRETLRQLKIDRIALNRDQVDEYNPPPNFAKVTDSRFADYQAVHGDQSWELDALDPATLDQLIQDHIDPLIDWDLWEGRRVVRDELRAQYAVVADNWDAIQEDYS